MKANDHTTEEVKNIEDLDGVSDSEYAQRLIDQSQKYQEVKRLVRAQREYQPQMGMGKGTKQSLIDSPEGGENPSDSNSEDVNTPTKEEIREMVVQEMNTRVIASILFTTGALLFGISVYAALQGAYLLSLILIPVPLATAYYLLQWGQHERIR